MGSDIGCVPDGRSLTSRDPTAPLTLDHLVCACILGRHLSSLPYRPRGLKSRWQQATRPQARCRWCGTNAKEVWGSIPGAAFAFRAFGTIIPPGERAPLGLINPTRLGMTHGTLWRPPGIIADCPLQALHIAFLFGWQERVCQGRKRAGVETVAFSQGSQSPMQDALGVENSA